MTVYAWCYADDSTSDRRSQPRHCALQSLLCVGDRAARDGQRCQSSSNLLARSGCAEHMTLNGTLGEHWRRCEWIGDRVGSEGLWQAAGGWPAEDRAQIRGWRLCGSRLRGCSRLLALARRSTWRHADLRRGGEWRGMGEWTEVWAVDSAHKQPTRQKCETTVLPSQSSRSSAHNAARSDSKDRTRPKRPSARRTNGVTHTQRHRRSTHLHQHPPHTHVVRL